MTAGGESDVAMAGPARPGSNPAVEDSREARASLESGLGFRMGRAHRALREAWGERIADLGLSPPQAAMLRAISERPGSGLRELARRAHTDPMNAKRLVDHLERAGLVASTVDPSHRQRRDLAPTDEGLVLADELARRAAVWTRRLARLLGAAELDQLQRLLARLEDALAAGAEGSRAGREQHDARKEQRR